MLGKGSAFAAECFAGGFIGADFEINEDLNRSLPDQWREFNKKFIPVYLAGHPGKSKVTAGLACGALWTISKGISDGDIVLSPDGAGSYRVGAVTGGYYYVAGGPLPHRRRVNWFDVVIARDAMSEALRNSTGSIGTVSNVSAHAVEIETFLKVAPPIPTIVATDAVIEDPAAFAMEKHLEAFLVANWEHTELGKGYSIFEEDGEKVGQQYETDAGPIDILAISKDKKRLLVVELKRGRASDVVVGQALRYMGYVKSEIAEADQSVEGAIIALEDDQKLRWALAVVPNISFYRYEIRFKLVRT
ncbi:endonuclease NucS domain-containing protein [Rhodoblastus sp.]|uniref:endonuclease NucS domain-containing protein n=1 Tax=Rhodoblastus sp. TaxID=1962975 RepID=UPI002620A9C5|nr:endonuclease NucS domain-containing protein [Rhodoblastus sp.]